MMLKQMLQNPNTDKKSRLVTAFLFSMPEKIIHPGHLDIFLHQVLPYSLNLLK